MAQRHAARFVFLALHAHPPLLEREPLGLVPVSG
jgi:hypothetical protein